MRARKYSIAIAVKRLIRLVVFIAVAVVLFFLSKDDPDVYGETELVGYYFICVLLFVLMAAVVAIIVGEFIDIFIREDGPVNSIVNGASSAGVSISSIVSEVNAYKGGAGSSKTQDEAFKFLSKIEIMSYIYDNWDVIDSLRSRGCLVVWNNSNNTVIVLDKLTNDNYIIDVKSMCSDSDKAEKVNWMLMINLDDAIVFNTYDLLGNAVSVTAKSAVV